MKSEKLINAYNATSTIDESTGDIETVEAWLERQLLNRIEKNNEAEKICKALAEWSEKYPRDRVYHFAKKDTIDGELIALEKRAKTLNM